MTVSPSEVERITALCQRAVECNRNTPTRRGNVVELTTDCAEDVVIFADLHGNRLNFHKLLERAALAEHPLRHLVLQEVCHGGPHYPGGGCMSHLLLEDVIELKTQFPERVHFLLSNHELAELGDFPICKARKMLNLQFRAGVAELYGCEAERVRQAYLDFLASCPLALRLPGGVFICHSLPEGCDQEPFDAEVFHRPLTADDWQQGSDVFRLVWGRDHRPENSQAFLRMVDARLLVLGHEPCPDGFSAPCPSTVILDGCCVRASYSLLPVGGELSQTDILGSVRYLHRNDQPLPACPATKP